MQISCPKLDILNVVLITIATPPPHTVLTVSIWTIYHILRYFLFHWIKVIFWTSYETIHTLCPINLWCLNRQNIWNEQHICIFNYYSVELNNLVHTKPANSQPQNKCILFGQNSAGKVITGARPSCFVNQYFLIFIIIYLILAKILRVLTSPW